MISIEILSTKLNYQRLFFKMTINWLTTVKNYGGKRPSKVVDFNASDADRVTAKTIDSYSFATTQIHTKRTFYASGLSSIFSCVSDLRNPSLSIFTLLEPCDASSPPYIEFKWNFHWWEAKHLTIWRKNLTVKLLHKKVSQQKRQHFVSIKNQWKKECLWKSNTLGNQ